MDFGYNAVGFNIQNALHGSGNNPDQYRFRVRSYKLVNKKRIYSAYSAPISAKVLPRDPSDLWPTVVDYTKIKRNWVDNSDNESGPAMYMINPGLSNQYSTPRRQPYRFKSP